MGDSHPSGVDAVGFVADWLLPSIRQARAPSFFIDGVLKRTEAERTYSALLAVEALRWIESGVELGLLPTRLLSYVDEQFSASLFAAQAFLASNARSLSADSPLRGQTNVSVQPLGDNHDDTDSRRLWLAFRTGMMLARSLGNARPVRYFLGTLFRASDDAWHQILRTCESDLSLDRFKLAINDRPRVRLFDAPLPVEQLAAGFLETLDHMAAVARMKRVEVESRVTKELFERVNRIQRCRLDLQDDAIRQRFVQFAGVLGGRLEELLREELSDGMESIGSTRDAFLKRTIELVGAWRRVGAEPVTTTYGGAGMSY